VISPEFYDFAKGGCCVSRASCVRRGFRLVLRLTLNGGALAARTKGYAKARVLGADSKIVDAVDIKLNNGNSAMADSHESLFSVPKSVC
jgi:hypothetical protein